MKLTEEESGNVNGNAHSDMIEKDNKLIKKNKLRNQFLIASLESNHSLWERIHDKYLPNLTEKVYYHKEQILYYLAKKYNSTENFFIKKQDSFWNNLSLSFPKLELVNHIKSKDQPIIFNSMINPPLFTSSEEEISFLSEAIISLQKKNKSIMESDDVLKSKSSYIQQSNENNDILQKRIENLCYQISSYQMRIIANSISVIQRNNNSKEEYIITYDPSTTLDPMMLSKSQYDIIKKYKEPILVTLTEPNKNNTITNNHYNEDMKMKLRSHHKRATITNQKASIIGSNIGINLPFCHMCKLRKEDTIKCTNNSIDKLINLKEFSVNKITLFIQNEIFFINDLPTVMLREIIFDYFYNRKVNGKKACLNYVCLSCIRNLVPLFDSIKDADKYICPQCNFRCYCLTCRCEMQLIKLIAYYLSFKWDINHVYDYCIERFPMIKLIPKEKLIWSRFVLCDFIAADADNKYKSNIDLLEPLKEYKMKLENYQKTFAKFFTQSQQKKINLSNSDNTLGNDNAINDNTIL